MSPMVAWVSVIAWTTSGGMCAALEVEREDAAVGGEKGRQIVVGGGHGFVCSAPERVTFMICTSGSAGVGAP